MRFHFHPQSHFRDWAERRHRSPPARVSHTLHPSHTPLEDAEVAKATVYISTVTLVVLLVVLAAIAFGQEAMHWLGVS